MSMAYDVIFSVIAGLPKVYPNFLRYCYNGKLSVCPCHIV